MKVEQFEHDGFNNSKERLRAEIRNFDTHAPLPPTSASDIVGHTVIADPRIASLVEFFKASAEADKVLLIQIAKLHADRNQGGK